MPIVFLKQPDGSDAEKTTGPDGNGRERLELGPFRIIAKHLVPVLTTLGILIVVIGPVASVGYLIFIHDPRSRATEQQATVVKKEIEQHSQFDEQRFHTLMNMSCQSTDGDAERWWASLRPDQQNYIRPWLPVPDKLKPAATALDQHERELQLQRDARGWPRGRNEPRR